MQIVTIGYEGATPEAFDRALLQAGVQMVVDVRAMAISRRKGFAKTALRSRLASLGIDYLHLKGLGDPKPGREAARAGDFVLFQRIFGAHMRTSEALADLAILKDLVTRQTVALVCYEANATECHRTVVARTVASSHDCEIVHLGLSGGTRIERRRADYRVGEGLAAA
ncbi:DUF488 family protein [Caulobacter sp. Root655]|uniref:DUF488 domain-containing protein n=1 Tax=Caulobacter sp. Root655 TaxID=1736578 RepID=UPI0009E6E4A8|nr:DUF488 domain-containing protein [Caulobacter sp. Root655]